MAEALEQVWEVVAGPRSPLAEELVRPDLVPERARRVVTVNAYERSSAAREICLEAHGWVCAVCGFDFRDVYGSLGSGLMQVHHVVPVDELDEDYELDPVADLMPVCGNCHMVIHSRQPALGVEEVRRAMR